MKTTTIARLQNRRGDKKDLPQPLSPGELGLCKDTKELFIGLDPESTSINPGFYVYSDSAGSPDLIKINTAKNYIDNGVLEINGVSMSQQQLDDLISDLETVVPAVTEVRAISISGNYVVVGVTPISVRGAVETYLTTGLLYSINTNTSSMYTENDGLFSPASGTATPTDFQRMNAYAAMINFIAADSIVSSNLNIKILTEYDSLTAGSPNDYIADPIVISLDPQTSFTTIPQLTYSTDSSDIVNIDYSIAHSSIDVVINGKLSIAVLQSANQSSLVDDANVINSTASQLLFRSVFDPVSQTVSIEYLHDFADSLTMKVLTKRWTKF